MTDAQKQSFQLPPEQQAIRDKCFHPSGAFVEFPIEDVETSILERFEKLALQLLDRRVVKLVDRSLFYLRMLLLQFAWSECSNQLETKSMVRHAKLPKKIIGSGFLVLVFVMVLVLTHVFAQPLYVLNAGGFDADADVSWPVVVAQEKGFLAKEGIQIKSIRTDKAMIGLMAGSFDVINAEAPATILAADKGANIAVVYVLSERPSQYMVLRKPLTKLRELEGETIGAYQIPSMVQLFLKRYLQKNNVDLSKVSFRRTGGSRERLASLLAGQSSATLLSTTYAFRAHQEGLKIITSPADWDKIPWNAITFRKPWAEANPNIVVRYLRAIHRATTWLYDPVNFSDALRTLTPLSGLDEATMRWALKSSIENKTFNLNKPDAGSFQAVSDWFLSETILSKPFNAASIIDTSYFDRAVK